jgi:hypothetical protein
MAFETVATVPGALLHATCVVMSRVVMSENRPVAVSVTVAPAGIDAIGGITVIETSVAGDTVTVACPVTVPNVAVMVVVPTARPVTVPAVAAAIETEAVIGADDVQTTLDVMSTMLPSLKVPVACSATVPPTCTVDIGGVTAMLRSVAAVTVTRLVPLWVPSVAVIVDVPAASARALPVAPIETTAVAELDQVTMLVRSARVPSE